MCPSRALPLVAACAAMLAACAPREDFEYIDASEIPPGPGLLTGETGSFELLSIDRSGNVFVGDGFADGGESEATPAKDGEAGKAVPEGLPPDKRHR